MDYRKIALEKLAALPSFWSVVKYPNRLFSGSPGQTNVESRAIDVQNGGRSPGYLKSDYFSKLFSNNNFRKMIGPEEADYLRGKLSDTDVYVNRGTKSEMRDGAAELPGGEGLTGGSQYNPFTGNITLVPYRRNEDRGKWTYYGKDTRLFNSRLDHERAHAMYENSPAYSSRFKDALEKFNIPYSLFYNPPWGSGKEYYENQPSEQAAVFNELRSQLGLMPGEGSGPDGTITQEDIDSAMKTKWYDKERYDRFFGDKPDKYLPYLFNNAKHKKPAAYRQQMTMMG